MATAQPADAQHGAAQRPVSLHRFQRVLRTGRREPAAQAERAKHSRQQRGNPDAVNTQNQNQQVLKEIHSASILTHLSRLSGGLQQFALPQSRQKISLHLRKTFAYNGRSRHEHEIERLV